MSEEITKRRRGRQPGQNQEMTLTLRILALGKYKIQIDEYKC